MTAPTHLGIWKKIECENCGMEHQATRSRERDRPKEGWLCEGCEVYCRMYAETEIRIAEAVEAEREACAKIADAPRIQDAKAGISFQTQDVKEIAQEIRNRKHGPNPHRYVNPLVEANRQAREALALLGALQPLFKENRIDQELEAQQRGVAGLTVDPSVIPPEMDEKAMELAEQLINRVYYLLAERASDSE